MRWIVVLVMLALMTGCFPPAGAQRSEVDNQTASRVNQLEQRVTALEQYIRQMYDVLAANGSLRAPANGGTAPAQPPTSPSPAPAPSPTTPSR